MDYYKDLRQYITALEEAGLLVRIRTEVKKETELMPVVRWQFRGLAEEQRRAMLFERVTDVHGRRYDSPVLVAALAGSRAIYAAGMRCRPEEISGRWTEAQLHPIPPRLVQSGPCQEEVHLGEELLQEGGGVEEFPVPINTPGFSGTLRTTASHWITKDPETGIRNVGNYSGHFKSRNHMNAGFHITGSQHICTHWKMAKERGQPLPAALVVGVVPAVAYTSVAKLPYGVDELAVAGGIAGEAIPVVKCKTVDLEVPATAEIVFEGEISTEYVEPLDGPFGEYCGYMAESELYPVFHITCITHRRQPIYQVLISQFPPSESSKIRQVAFEEVLYKFLRYDCNIPSVLRVAFHESSGSWEYCVIQMRKTNPAQPWQALNGAVALEPTIGKIIIVVDEDIDPRDPDAVNWALSFRMQPHRDLRITQGKGSALDPSAAHPSSPEHERNFPAPTGTSAVLIDATRKWDYPPVSLPKREYMERARQIWEQEGLPALTPKLPWFGYELGYLPDAYRQAAEANVRGELFPFLEKSPSKRQPV